MEATVATLLLLTASVVLACVVVDYAINISQQTLNGDSPPLDHLKTLTDNLLNQTNNVLNETQAQINQSAP